MKQQTTHNWQHSPSKTQVASNPVKAVSKSLHKAKISALASDDLMGLSWVLFEEKY